jgi:hypothetical protein
MHYANRNRSSDEYEVYSLYQQYNNQQYMLYFCIFLTQFKIKTACDAGSDAGLYFM